MKKRIVAQILAFCLSAALCACGGTAATDTSGSSDKDVAAVETEVTEPAPDQSSDAQETDTQEASGEEAEAPASDSSTPVSSPERDLPESDYADIGDGTFYIASASGSTENGDEVLVYPDMDSIPFAYIDYELWDMDGSVQTYIYLDGVEMDKQQVGAGYQSSLSLEEEWQVSAGTHKVEAVQYEGNDPSGTISFYRSAEFTVASGDTASPSGADTTTSLPDGAYSDVGNGTFYISNASGSTENGDEIIVYPDMDSIPFAYIDYELWDLDGSVLTYIYLDGAEIEKQQVGEGFQGTIPLTDKSQVTEGKHTVAAVQYEGNDPAGKILFSRSAEFTVKNQ